MILSNVLFLTLTLVWRLFFKIHNLLGIFLKSLFHYVVFWIRNMFNHCFKMELFFRYVLFAFHLFLNFSFSDFIIKWSDNFGFHVLFLFLSSQTSPVELSIFSKEFLTFLNFREIHGKIISWKIFLHFFFVFISLNFSLSDFYGLFWFKVVFKIIKSSFDHFISDFFFQNIFIKFIIFSKDILFLFGLL